MGQVELIFLVFDHICKPSSEVGVNKGAVLQLKLEACVKGNEESRFPTYGEYKRM